MKYLAKVKKYLLDYNLRVLGQKIGNGTATDQEVASFSRMEKYAQRGHW